MVAKRTTGSKPEQDAEVTAVTPHDSLTGWLPEEMERDPDRVQREIVARMFAADSIADLFDTFEGKNSKQLEGRRFEVQSVKWDIYHADKGDLPLALVSAIDLDTGESIDFPTTAPALTAFIRKCEIAGWLPFRAKITGKLTKGGQTALNFERV